MKSVVGILLVLAALAIACSQGPADPVGKFTVHYTSPAGDELTLNTMGLELRADHTYAYWDQDLKISGTWEMDAQSVTLKPEQYSGSDRQKRLDPRAKPNKLIIDSNGRELRVATDDGSWGYTVFQKQ